MALKRKFNKTRKPKHEEAPKESVNSPSKAESSGGTSIFKTSPDQIRQASKKQQAENDLRAKERSMPFRFYLKRGESKRYVILDDEVTFGMFEHTIKTPDGRYRQEICIKEKFICPLCEAGLDNGSKFRTFLSVIDTTPFTTKNNVTVPFSKKLLPISDRQQNQFYKYHSKYGTLRGLVIDAERSDSQTSYSIGDVLMVDDQMSDEQLLAQFATDAVVNDGKVIREKNHCLTPFNYLEVFTPKTTEELRMQYGGSRPIGDDSGIPF